MSVIGQVQPVEVMITAMLLYNTFRDMDSSALVL
jgi:hypothetical protein